jgi:hypothetical protein
VAKSTRYALSPAAEHVSCKIPTVYRPRSEWSDRACCVSARTDAELSAPLGALVEAEAMLDRGVSISGLLPKQITVSLLDVVSQSIRLSLCQWLT